MMDEESTMKELVELDGRRDSVVVMECSKDDMFCKSRCWIVNADG